MSPSPIRVGISGARGKMGRLLTELIRDDAEFSRRFRLEEKISAEAELDLVIDFSAPEACLAVAEMCASRQIPLFIGTTGFAGPELQTLHRTLQEAVWALVPNTSLGIFALGEALKALLTALPETFQASVVEIHHAAKKDAPSGTAKLLEKIISAHQKSSAEVPVFSVRAGTDPGEHRILILGPAERLEISHRAESRSLFARGALQLAERLVRKAPRPAPYEVSDLLSD